MSDDTAHYRIDPYAEDELVPFDARDYSGKRAMRLLIIFVVALLLAAFLLFKLYYDGTRDRNAPPRINAEKTPFKVELENPGGAVTPNQDKTIYDVMNGRVKEEVVVPAQSAELPINMPDKATIVVEDDTPIVKPPVVRDIPAPKPVSPATPLAIDSDYVVQIASVRTRDDAERLWNELNQKFNAGLPRATYADIRRADLGDRGIFYRLRVAGLESKGSAEHLCDRLKSHNQACFVTRK